MTSYQRSLFADEPPGPTIYNVASVPQRSVFRYPGGKTWFVPYLRRWLAAKDSRVLRLIEPFAGGGIVGLTCAFEGLVDQVVLVEIDPNVAAVWHTLLSEDATWLAETILRFEMNADQVQKALESPPSSTRERAFQTILRNRVNRGGILAAGAGRMKHGEYGQGLASRWYPATLARRIMAIAAQRERLTFIEGDGLSVLEEAQDQTETAFFIDPPYTVGGKRTGQRLYDYSAVDHQRLFSLAHDLAGDFLMTYDDSAEVRHLSAQNGFASVLIPMKNTHHAAVYERLIGRDLSWLKSLFQPPNNDSDTED